MNGRDPQNLFVGCSKSSFAHSLAVEIMSVAVAQVAVAALLVCVAVADFADLYKGSFVEDVDPTTFDAKVVEYPGAVLLQFYTTWSPNCKKFAPIWVEVAEALKAQGSSVRVAMIDADAHREFTRRFKLEGYPTLASFGKYTKVLPTYGLTTDSSVDEILSHAAELDAATEEDAAAALKEVRETKKKGSPKRRRSSKDEDDNSSGGASEKSSSERKKKKSSKSPKGDKKSKDRKKSSEKGKETLKRPFTTDDGAPPPDPPVRMHDDIPVPPLHRPSIHEDGDIHPVGVDHHDLLRRAPPHMRHHRPSVIDPLPHLAEAAAVHGHVPHPLHRTEGDDAEWEERRKKIPPRTAEDDAKHAKLVEEHRERVRQRKEEREERRLRGTTNEHDEMYFKHEQMISDARRRHDDHMAEVMRRHEEVMAEVRQRMDNQRQELGSRFGAEGNGDNGAVTVDEVNEIPAASAEAVDAL